MSERLKGKVGIVTGAGSGIGRACAVALAEEGASVALVGRRKDRIEAVTHHIGDFALAIAADVTRSADIDRVVAQTIKHFGTLNFLLNNAGILQIGNAEQISEEQWDRVFNVNVR
ncbi:MAG: SDR family NAD(P)-dependent oxidoreductase, partial [Acidobacteria bacterium]|nr:SDR family NAD(P)-dependent oxidoreductase [Acidobacteriota bacterium]